MKEVIKIVKNEAAINTLEIALLAKRSLEVAGYEVELVGFENTNKIDSFTDADLAYGEREANKLR